MQTRLFCGNKNAKYAQLKHIGVVKASKEGSRFQWLGEEGTG